MTADTDREARCKINVYTTPDQGIGVNFVKPDGNGFRISGPKLYGQSTVVLSVPVGDRARRYIRQALRGRVEWAMCGCGEVMRKAEIREHEASCEVDTGTMISGEDAANALYSEIDRLKAKLEGEEDE